MFKLPQRDTKTLLAIHGWSGILLGLLLYAVICTGVAAVFAEEINDWASPLSHPKSAMAFPLGLDATVRRLAHEVDPEFLADIAIYRSAGGRVNVRYHHDETNPQGRPDERGVEFELDPANWQVLARRAGWSDEMGEQERAGGIADFLINLHVRLHIPDPYGLFVTGVLGLAMMIAAVTGLIIHRHLLKELFTLRLGRDALLRRRDLHVVAASWNLPFAIVLAFTGSFFSFASSIGLPAIAMVKFSGDRDALTEVLAGRARQENRTPAPLTNLEALIADTRARNHVEPDYVSIEHYGRADSTVSVSTDLPVDQLVYSDFLYDGASGQFIRELPPLGTVPSAGASLIGLMYPLHFGNFAGAVSKAVWVALGFAAAYVTLTGMLLWTRRREEQPVWRRMARVVHFVGYGLPLALACAPYAFFALRHTQFPMGTSQDLAFLATAAATAVAARSIKDLDRLRSALLSCTGLALLGLPAIRMATGGLGWIESVQGGFGIVPMVDLVLIISGCGCIWAARTQNPAPAETSAPASSNREARRLAT